MGNTAEEYSSLAKLMITAVVDKLLDDDDDDDDNTTDWSAGFQYFSNLL